MKNKENGYKAQEVRDFIQDTLANDKAQDIVTIDLSGKSDMADFMIVASGTSSRHVGSMAEKLVERLRKAGYSCFGTEGFPTCDWVLVDNPFVVVHLFRPDLRKTYNLEKMWDASMPIAEMAH